MYTPCPRCERKTAFLYPSPKFRRYVCGACMNALHPFDHSYCPGSKEARS